MAAAHALLWVGPYDGVRFVPELLWCLALRL